MSAAPVSDTRAPAWSVGLDVVHVAGLASRLAASPGLEARLFTPREQAHAAGDPAPEATLAACFAVKEALLKALRRGLSPHGLDGALLEVECAAGARGVEVALSGRVAALLERRGHAPPVASVSQAGGYALASVVLRSRA